MQNQKGLSLLEIMLAILIITFVVASMMKALSRTLTGQSQDRNRLPASTLARTKIDALKGYARQSAEGGTFSSLTLSPLLISYAVTQTAVIQSKTFTWNVSSTFVTMASVSNLVDVTSNTVTSKLIRYKALVTWGEGPYAKFLTQTAVVSDPSQ